MYKGCLINKRTVRTAKNNDQVIRHVPRGCSDRHPTVLRTVINITLHPNATLLAVRLFIRQILYICTVIAESQFS